MSAILSLYKMNYALVLFETRLRILCQSLTVLILVPILPCKSISISEGVEKSGILVAEALLHWNRDTVRRPLKEAFLASKIVILDYFSRELPF